MKHGPATIAGRYETVDSETNENDQKDPKNLKKSTPNSLQNKKKPPGFTRCVSSGATRVAWKQRAARKGAPPEILWAFSGNFEYAVFNFPGFFTKKMRISEGMVFFYAFWTFPLRILIVFNLYFSLFQIHFSDRYLGLLPN